MVFYILHIAINSDGDFPTRKNEALYKADEISSPSIVRCYLSKEKMYSEAIILLKDSLEGLKYNKNRVYLNEVVDDFRKIIKQAIDDFANNKDKIDYFEDYGNQTITIETYFKVAM